MKTSEFFGLKLDQKFFSVDEMLKLIGIGGLIDRSKSVRKYKQLYHDGHFMVIVAKRQATLKLLRENLNEEMLSYDPFHYKKENNTGSDADRRYNAEDRLIRYALVIATGKPYHRLSYEGYQTLEREIRELDQRKRFQRLWDILLEDVGDEIEKYREQEPAEAGSQSKKGFFKRLFSLK